MTPPATTPTRDDGSAELDRELKALLVGTNDLRRRTGQALYHLYRTLIFWGRRGKGFADATRLWCAAAASIFDTLVTSLREAGSAQEDAPLRRYVQEVLRQLAEDLAAGDRMQHGWLRWLESRFPRLTELMQDSPASLRILDSDLALTLAEGLTLVAGASDDQLPARLRDLAGDLAPLG